MRDKIDQEALEKLRSKVLAWAEQWQARLALEHWNICWCFYDSSAEYAQAIDQDSDSMTDTMASIPNWPYLSGSIHVNGPECIEHTDSFIEETVVHELVHFHLAELGHLMRITEDAMMHIEHVTSYLAYAFVRTHSTSQHEEAMLA